MIVPAHIARLEVNGATLAALLADTNHVIERVGHVVGLPPR